MRVLFVGAGAVGGYFGALMQRAGRDVTFLLRPARAAAVRSGGLTVIEPDERFTVTPVVVTSDEINGAFDVVVVSVKSYGLGGATTDMAPAVGPDTLVLPLLNGMAHIETLRARFGTEATLGGVAMISSTLDDEGRIVHMVKRPGTIAYGDFGPEPGKRSHDLDADFHNCGFQVISSEDIERAMWMKWVGLATIGAMTSLMRSPTGGINAVPGGDVVARTILTECVAVSTAWGYPPNEDEMAEWTARYTDPTTMGTSSMYRDLAAGLPTEGDQIVGDLVRRAAARGVAAPTLNLAAISLEVVERARLA